jgi:hypothetical protein
MGIDRSQIGFDFIQVCGGLKIQWQWPEIEAPQTHAPLHVFVSLALSLEKDQL